MNRMDPTQLDLAFALAINRLKPAHKPVREFILDLRKHIYPGIRPQFSATHEESRHNYINAALYFEAKQRESEKQNETLLNEVASLKRQLAALGEVPNENIWASRSCKKRKRASGDQSVESHGGDILKQLEQLADHFQSRNKDESCIHLLRKLFDLQSAMNESPMQHQSLYEHFRNTCASFCIVLSEITKKSTPQMLNHDQLLQGLPQALSIMVLVLKKIGSYNVTQDSQSALAREEGKSLDNKLIYGILTIFRVLLDICRHFSIDDIRCVAQGGPKISNKHSDDVISSTGISDLVKHLRTLGRTFLALALKARSDAEASNDTRLSGLFSAILEGSLYMLLARAGKLLYTLTFGTHRRESLEAEILSFPTSTENADSSSPIQRRRGTRCSNVSSSDTQISTRTVKVRAGTRQITSVNDERRAAEIEARSLIAFLELLLPYNVSSESRSKLRQRHVSSPSHGGQSACSNNSHENLTKKGRNGSSLHPADARAERNKQESIIEKPLHVLQNTLIAAIFGPASVPESHLDPDIFGETLKCPADLSHDLDSSHSANVTVEEHSNTNTSDGEEGGAGDNEVTDRSDRNGRWFVRRMWELVGWDILAQGFASEETDQPADSTDVSGEDMACEPEEYLI